MFISLLHLQWTIWMETKQTFINKLLTCLPIHFIIYSPKHSYLSLHVNIHIFHSQLLSQIHARFSVYFNFVSFIRPTILTFARYIAILLSYFTGYVSLPCNIQFLTQLLHNFLPNKLQSVSGSQTGRPAIKHILCIPANTTVPVLASPSDEVHKGNTHHRKCHNKYHVTKHSVVLILLLDFLTVITFSVKYSYCIQ